ncbi:MAG: YihY/virulence factor BrkB family protein [Clostridiales bacterium]|nr:YihY/virulence factor BrkB family protein [Clostridiales bacterium]
MKNTDKQSQNNRPGLISRLIGWGQRFWAYCSEGVWSDTRRDWRISIIKTLNLSVRSFLDRDLQSQAAAMTYKTVLAIVPALALFFAIGKGFGIQENINVELHHYFPAQTEAIDKCMTFIDHYLEASTEGLFVGIGIVFLLYTLISLLGSVEDSFNLIWGLKEGRSWGRKITDYTAILLILPLLLILSSGITVFVTTLLQSALPFPFLSPVITYAVDFLGILLGWLFFAGSYMLIPNTRVKFKNAFIAGAIAGTGYFILQWLFVSGQLYVTRYNAIYGSFAFLPLLLIWLQLVWLITLAGGVLCYASQSIFEFSFSNEINRISFDYRRKILVGVLLITVKRREQGLPPINEQQISLTYGLPISLVTKAANDLIEVGLIDKVLLKGKNEQETYGISPAIDTEDITLGLVIKRLRKHGSTDFIPDFNNRFKGVVDAIDSIEDITCQEADKYLLRDLPFSDPNQ